MQSKERYRIIFSILLILIREGKVFMLRRYNTGYRDGQYSFIAGHVEEGETAKEGIQREAKEEAGIDIDLKDLKLVHVVHRVKDERIVFYFTVSKWKGTPYNNEPEKCDDARWFPLEKLPTNTSPYVKKALKNYQNGVIYDEFK